MEEEDFPKDTAFAGGAFAFIDFAEAHGLSRAKLLAAAGLEDALRADPDARVPIFAYVVLWREMIVGLPGLALPVELIRSVDSTLLGVLGQILVRADDVGHAHRLVTQFQRLPDTAFRAFQIDRGDDVGLGIGHLPQVEAMRFPLELMLGVGVRALQRATRGTLPITRITFAHAPGYPVAAYEDLFGVPVEFGARETAVWLPRSALALPLAAPDPGLRAYLEAHAARLIAALPPVLSPVVAQIRSAVLEELATSGAELARVAKKVAMSTRTVQRRLEEAGTSFHDLVDEVRAALARDLLRDRSRPIVDVAFELGYADLKGFYRALRRWNDTTPAAWRAKAHSA